MAIDGGYTGQEVAFEISYDQSKTVVPTDFVRVGAVRNKEFGVEWEDVDATADDSDGGFREYLATFKSFPVTLSGVSRVEESKNQKDMETFVLNPPNNTPRGWAKFTRPLGDGTLRTYAFPCMFTSYKLTAGYDTVVEWNCDAKATGNVVVVDI